MKKLTPRYDELPESLTRYFKGLPRYNAYIKKFEGTGHDNQELFAQTHNTDVKWYHKAGWGYLKIERPVSPVNLNDGPSNAPVLVPVPEPCKPGELCNVYTSALGVNAVGDTLLAVDTNDGLQWYKIQRPSAARATSAVSAIPPLPQTLTSDQSTSPEPIATTPTPNNWRKRVIAALAIAGAVVVIKKVRDYYARKSLEHTAHSLIVTAQKAITNIPAEYASLFKADENAFMRAKQAPHYAQLCTQLHTYITGIKSLLNKVVNTGQKLKENSGADILNKIALVTQQLIKVQDMLVYIHVRLTIKETQ